MMITTLVVACSLLFGERNATVQPRVDSTTNIRARGIAIEADTIIGWSKRMIKGPFATLSTDESDLLREILARCHRASKEMRLPGERNWRVEIRSGRHRAIYIDNTYFVQQAGRSWVIAEGDRKAAEALSENLAYHPTDAYSTESE